MYVDGLKNNLLSVSQMSDQGNGVVFQLNRCVVREFHIWNTVIKGKKIQTTYTYSKEDNNNAI